MSNVSTGESVVSAPEKHADVQVSTESDTVNLKRSIGLGTAVSIIVGGIIGTTRRHQTLAKDPVPAPVTAGSHVLKPKTFMV